MTEKRFVERYAGRRLKSLIGIKDIETNRVCVTIEENIRLLNELNEVAKVIEGKMGDNVCNNYKMQVLEEVWNELELDKVWFE